MTSTYDSRANVTRITGTSGADVIVGTPGRDVIRGRQGNDIICGVDGNDLILAGNGSDTIFGGAGADSIFGGSGSDRIFAGSGSDNIFGERHADTIRGGDGHDRILGGDGHDVINGGNGHDTINGQYGRDTINGNRGRDNINGGSLDDVIDGGPDADIITGNVGVDTCNNRQGIDTIRNCERSNDAATPEPDPTPRPPVGTGTTVRCDQASLATYFEGRIGTESPNLADAERRLFDMINETREICDLDPLTVHGPADQQAQLHSQDMLNGKNSGSNSYFQHSNRWRSMIGSNGVSTAGENIALVAPTVDPTVIHRNLIESGGHLCNVLAPHYDGLGLGFTYFDSSANRGQIVTEMFVGDSAVEQTTGSLTVRNDLHNPNSGTINCWD